MQFANQPGGMNNTAPDSSHRFYLLQLQVVLNVFVESPRMAATLGVVVTAALAGLFIWLRLRRADWERTQTGSLNIYRVRRAPDELLSVSIVAVLTLLPVYHRFYDAAVLVIPLAWATAHLRTWPRMAVPVLLLVMTFTIPGIATIRLEQWLGSKSSVISTWWWHAFVEPWRVWTLLICLALLYRAAGPQVWGQLRAFATDHVASAAHGAMRLLRQRPGTPHAR
jgi:hypothetical protein